MIVSVLTLMAAVVLSPRPKPPAAEAAIRAQLQKRYDTAAAAFRRRDVAAIMNITSPGLKSRRPNGQTWNRNQLQVYMNLTIGALKTIDGATFRVVKVTRQDNDAVALVDHRVWGTLGGNGKPKRITDVSTDRDIWTHTPEGWMLTFTECVKENVTLDGKRIDPSPAAIKPTK
jgi:hypothetical protein